MRFAPREPQCCQAHCYIKGDALELDQARDAVFEAMGVNVYHRLRGLQAGPEGDECYFEWTLGPAHVDVPDEHFVVAWARFFEVLAALQNAKK
mmetsp:Transcript_1654/g.2699  ORF Transcript_1654/g.2699 Transcript_1654/m.2699 type:complete len:93 (-) Transcript_1654:314-592(-)